MVCRTPDLGCNFAKSLYVREGIRMVVRTRWVGGMASHRLVNLGMGGSGGGIGGMVSGIWLSLVKIGLGVSAFHPFDLGAECG